MVCWCSGSKLWSQQATQYLYVDSIIYEGNKKTKSFVLQRELSFKLGDSLELSGSSKVFRRSEELLMNTSLFTKATINIVEWRPRNRLVIKVTVSEDWYIYPIPILELADRNFNVWLVDMGAKLNRLNFGAYLYYNNLGGQADQLVLTAQWGYTRKLELSYRVSNLGRHKKLGFSISGLYSANKEMAYTTANDKLKFYRNIEADQYLFHRLRGIFTLNYRPTLFTKHEFGVQYQYLAVSDSIFNRNPEIINNQTASQSVLSLFYRFVYDTRDVKSYAKKGLYVQTYLMKEGFGASNEDLNLLAATVSAAYHKSLSSRWHISHVAEVKKTLLGDFIPYYNFKSLGYSQDYVRGYQYYVIDGQDYVYSQNDLHFKLTDFKYKAKFIPIQAFKVVPVALYLRAHLDFGYVRNTRTEANALLNNRLPNNFLLGTGLGIDAVALYNMVFQFDFTVNKEQQAALYFRYKLKF